jgi:hypothetical protein
VIDAGRQMLGQSVAHAKVLGGANQNPPPNVRTAEAMRLEAALDQAESVMQL